jgi:poly(3-hydroxybutyrate) depolymerase
LNGKATSWTMFMGAPKTGGPLIIYWHGTASAGSVEVPGAFGTGLQEIMNLGGVVAAAETSSGVGPTTNEGVWSQGDVDYADQIVACAIAQLHIDTHHIHVAGYSAGGMHTAYMWYTRSGYVASVATYSGGTFIINVAPQQDPYLPAAVVAHGGQGQDVFILDFNDASTMWEADIKAKGGFAIVTTAAITSISVSAWPSEVRFGSS